MAQSLCRIYLHIIFHTKTTSPVIDEEHIPQMHAYIGALVNTTGCQVLCVGGTENHIHVLLMFSKNETVAHIVEEVKRNSSRWIKTISPKYEKFAWQGGYAAFSVSQSQVDTAIEYIRNQAEHHKKRSFKDEYLEFLRLYKIEYDERYVLSD
ncbi:MAG: IS200/IS605 family transposase [Bacteroidales bacterium]|nr:IS200/IS605 family transposase [Bacteroidales bacterium]